MAPTRPLAACLVLAAGLLVACQGARLPAAPPRADWVAATQPARDAGQPARDAGFDTFLRGAGETATGIPFDLERALDKAVAASKRDPVPPREGEGYCPWALEDEIDRIACERGVSREHARQLHSNRPYAEPEAGR